MVSEVSLPKVPTHFTELVRLYSVYAAFVYILKISSFRQKYAKANIFINMQCNGMKTFAATYQHRVNILYYGDKSAWARFWTVKNKYRGLYLRLIQRTDTRNKTLIFTRNLKIMALSRI